MNRRALLFLLAAGAMIAADQKQSGPLGLIVEYRCAPANRVAFRTAMKASRSVFEKLLSSGAISGYHLLFSRYVHSNSWDALAVIDFSSYDAVHNWKNVEASTPAGLTSQALSLVTSIETFPADVARTGSGKRGTKDAVYFVIPYSLTVPVPVYQKYADDYVIPQFQGWMEEGILLDFRIYLQRYTAGRRWDALILLQYKDDASFGRREEVVNKVRARLAANAAWKAISDNKQSVRVEKEAVIADDLAIP